MTRLEITDKRILSFYEKNPNIDFQTVNLLFIDLLEKTYITGDHVLSNLRDEMDSLKEFVSSSHTDNLTKALSNFKDDYISEIHEIVDTNTHDKIAPLLEKNNCYLMEKTTNLISDILTSSHSINGPQQLIPILQEFANTINNETQHLLKSSDNTSLKEFINSYEMKTSMMLQPIYSYISASEERTNSAIRDGQSKLLSEFTETLTKFNNIRTNQQHIDKHLTNILTKLYSSSEVQTKNNAGGLIVLKRQGRPNIIIENRDTEDNIPVEEVQSFTLSVDDHNCCGILISQQSGISTKKNYQIEIHNNNVIIYVHHAEYNPARIATAVDIIDQLSSKMRQFKNSGGDDCAVPKEVMDAINNEYQLFLSQKNAVIEVFKESQKKVLSQIDEIRFPALDKFLSTKYSAPIQKQGLKCDLCKSFSANNLKALAAHKRGCIRKIGNSKMVCDTSLNSNIAVVTPLPSPIKPMRS